MPPVALRPAHRPAARAPARHRARRAHASRCSPAASSGSSSPAVNEATLRVLAAEGCEVVVRRGIGLLRRAVDPRRPRRRGPAVRPRAIEALERDRRRRHRRQRRRLRLVDEGVRSPVRGRSGVGRARRARIAAKVKDVTSCSPALGPVAPRHPLRIKVAYHDACHLAHAQRIRAQPRALLAAHPRARAGRARQRRVLRQRRRPQPARAGRARARSASARSTACSPPRPSSWSAPTRAARCRSRCCCASAASTCRTAHPIEILDASIRGVALGGADVDCRAPCRRYATCARVQVRPDDPRARSGLSRRHDTWCLPLVVMHCSI